MTSQSQWEAHQDPFTPSTETLIDIAPVAPWDSSAAIRWLSALEKLLFATHFGKDTDEHAASEALRPFLRPASAARPGIVSLQGLDNLPLSSLGIGRQELVSPLMEARRILDSSASVPQRMERLDQIEGQVSDVALLGEMINSPSVRSSLWAFGHLVLRRSPVLALVNDQLSDFDYRLRDYLTDRGNPLGLLAQEVVNSGLLGGNGPGDQLRRALSRLSSLDSHFDHDELFQHLSEFLAQMSEDSSHEFVAQCVLRYRSNLGDANAEDRVRPILDRWLDHPNQSLVKVASAELLRWVDEDCHVSMKGWPPSESRLNLRYARRELEGLATWASLKRWVIDSHDHPCVTAPQLRAFIQSGQSIDPDHVETWRNEVARGALLAATQREILAEILNDSSMQRDVLRNLPTDAIPRWFNEIRRSAERSGRRNGSKRRRPHRGRTRADAARERGHAALRALWPELLEKEFKDWFEKNPASTRLRVVIEHYLDAVRRIDSSASVEAHSALNRLITDIFEWMRDLGVERSARMWESRIAATPLTGSADYRSESERLKEAVELDMGNAKAFTAGLWTTLVVRELLHSLARGIEQLGRALKDLAQNAPNFEDPSDRWFSEKEIVRLLRALPDSPAYSLAEDLWKSRLARALAGGTDDSGALRTRLMLTSLGWALARAGEVDLVSKVLTMLARDEFRGWEEFEDGALSSANIRSTAEYSRLERDATDLAVELSRLSVSDGYGAVAQLLAQSLGAVPMDTEEQARHGLLLSNVISILEEPAAVTPEDVNGWIQVEIRRYAEQHRIELGRELDVDRVGQRIRNFESSQRAIASLSNALALLDHDLGNDHESVVYDLDTLRITLDKQLKRIRVGSDGEELGDRLVDFIQSMQESIRSIQANAQAVSGSINLVKASTNAQSSKDRSLSSLVNELVKNHHSDARPVVLDWAAELDDITDRHATTAPPAVVYLVLNTMLLNAKKYADGGAITVRIYSGIDKETLAPVVDIMVVDEGDGANALQDGIKHHVYADEVDRFQNGREVRGLLVAASLVGQFGATLTVRPAGVDDSRPFPVLRLPIEQSNYGVAEPVARDQEEYAHGL